MSELSWAQIVRLVHQRAGNCCEYCRTCQRVCGQAMHVEHIDPAGGSDLENLCLSCPSCNLSKAKATTASDPHMGTIVSLFNPRVQQWNDHFEWHEQGAVVAGKTPTGRATIDRLKMNLDRIVTARKIWIKADEHPPSS
jgi:5-methylcytosine-specific restriction endonuclease McrA